MKSLAVLYRHGRFYDPFRSGPVELRDWSYQLRRLLVAGQPSRTRSELSNWLHGLPESPFIFVSGGGAHIFCWISGSATSSARLQGSMTLCQELARMVNAFLDPAVPRLMHPGGNLNSLRVRLERNVLTEHPRDVLCEEVRQAMRTEFFKVAYPSPPSPKLLQLATRVEIILTVHTSPVRPFYFPGARVSLPSEKNPLQRNIGTTLQLRSRQEASANEPSVPEALVHVDGPNGGSFRWILTTLLVPLYVPQPLVVTGQLKPRPPQTATVSGALGKKEPSSAAPGPSSMSHRATSGVNKPSGPSGLGMVPRNPQTGVGNARSKSVSVSDVRFPGGDSQAAQTNGLVCQIKPRPRLSHLSGARQAVQTARPRRDDGSRLPRGVAQFVVQDALPQGFVPDSLRSASPPPRKRLRQGLRPVCLLAGSVLALCPARPDGPLKPHDAQPSIPISDRAVGVNGEPVAEAQSSAHVDVLNASKESVPPPEHATASSDCRSMMRSSRPEDAVLSRMLPVERLAARRKCARSGHVEYYVKWRNVSWAGCSWETRDALLQDIPGLVHEFDVRHPEPASSFLDPGHSPAEANENERETRCPVEIPSNSAASALQGNPALQGTIASPAYPASDSVLIPTWFEEPFLELPVSGMLLHFRREECAVLLDTAAASRDVANRKNRLAREFPDVFNRLFIGQVPVPTTLASETVKSAIDESLRKRVSYGSRPIHYPRSLGSALTMNLAHPPSKMDVLSAPESWESFMLGLGLTCTNWERDHRPWMPFADSSVHLAVEHAQREMDMEERRVRRERCSRLLRDRYDRNNTSSGRLYGSVPPRTRSSRFCLPAPEVPSGMYCEETMPFPSGLAKSELLEVRRKTSLALLGSTAGERTCLSEASTSPRCDAAPLLRERSRIVRSRLEASSQLKSAKKHYDPIWCCWREEPSS